MSKLDQIVGEINDSSCQRYLEWKIDNYFSLSQKTNTVVESPVFHFSKSSWCLKIHPNGSRNEGSVGYMSFFLHRKDFQSDDFINCSLGIKNSEKCYEFSHSFNSNEGYGYPKFLSRNDLLRWKAKVAPGGTLTVFCRMKRLHSIADVALQTAFLDNTRNLSRDFENLFQSEKESDVTIRVEGRSFRVHKLILGTRSSVFSAMFEHNMKEKCQGIVDIEDCDPDIFRDFLSFLYTGKLEKLSSGKVTGLFYLADKYDVADLKIMCLEFMKDNIRLEGICDVFLIADRHNYPELKKSAAELIRKNLKTLIPTSQWISFMAENPTLAAELLMAVIPDK